jgi:hypothetical protein
LIYQTSSYSQYCSYCLTDAIAIDRQETIVLPKDQALLLDALEEIKILLQQLGTPTVEP